ncbi:amidohydrolase family protein [Ekhidna sp.]|uniref:amidohydrolase family protein n=1 Tax=Ekhidna sp. TaxID=2608089 RepID=UPI0032977C2A
MKKINIIIALMLTVTFVMAQKKGSVLIKSGTVLTVTNGTLENTDVLIRDGKISKIGKGLSAPSGSKIIDASGMFVMPGIIDAHSHLALDAVNEATSPVTAEVWVGDALDPLDVGIYQALAGGVTSAHSMHGSANAIGGQCETVKFRYGEIEPDKLRMAGAPRTIKFALGENPTRVHGSGNGIQPRTRMGVEHVIRSSFQQAKEYKAAWDEYNAKKKDKRYKGKAPAYDLRLETLADILRGDIIIHCHSYRADEIYMLMQVCKDYGIKRLVFQHVNEGFKVAPELAKFGAGASVFADWWAYKFEVYYSTAYNAAILTKNGVTTSINSDSGELIRHLYHEAAKSQKYGGLTDDQALSLITINPAKQLGIADRVGSLEEGKEGDVAIFKNHPLSIYAIPTVTIVDGIVRFDRENDPADMRLYPDPEEKIDVTLWEAEDHDRCMANTEFLFTDK